MYALPSLQPNFREQLKNECSIRSKTTGSTIFGTAISPKTSSSDDNDKQHLVACTSDGMLLIWDLSISSPSFDFDDGDGTGGGDENARPHFQGQVHQSMKKRKITKSCSPSKHNEPVEVNVCRGVLYDVQFIQDNDDESTSQVLLLTCGDEGVFVFQWSDVLSKIEMRKKSTKSNRNKNIIIQNVTPESHLKPYPNSFSPMTPTEINQLSYDASSKKLYGAAGDSFGAYIWDIQTSQIVGNLGTNMNIASRGGSGSCHSDYLLSIQCIPDCTSTNSSHCILTGGSDGKVGIWSGKNQKLIDSIDFNTVLGKGSTSSSSSSISSNHQSSSLSSSSTWVSSMDVHPEGNWAVIGGGMDHANSNAITSTFPSTVKQGNCSASGGFTAMLHLPTRTVSTYKETNETIHNVAYHSNGAGIVSVGNDCAASFWNPMDVSQGQTSRSWLSSPASYSIGIHPENDIMVVAGVGCTIDCFSPFMTKTCTLRRRI